MFYIVASDHQEEGQQNVVFHETEQDARTDYDGTRQRVSDNTSVGENYAVGLFSVNSLAGLNVSFNYGSISIENDANDTVQLEYVECENSEEDDEG